MVRPGQRSDRSAGILEQRGDVLVGQVGDVGRGRRGGRARQLGGGIAVEQFEDPAEGDVLDEQGQFGKGQRQEMVELVDRAGCVAGRWLGVGWRPAGAFAAPADSGVVAAGSFAEGVASSGLGLDGIGLLAAEEGGAVVFVALRIAAGDGEGALGRQQGDARERGEAVQEVQEVVGVLPGDVEADGEGDGPWRWARCSRRWRNWA